MKGLQCWVVVIVVVVVVFFFFFFGPNSLNPKTFNLPHLPLKILKEAKIGL